jgi:hypothetical protein
MKTEWSQIKSHYLSRLIVLPRVEARHLGIPEQVLRPILPPPGLLKGSFLSTEADGYPCVQPQLALIDCKLPGEELARSFSRFWSYLERGQRRGVHETYLARRRSPWYAQERRPPTPFLCTYLRRAANGRKPFRFLWNRSRATAHNVYLLLHPCRELSVALAADPDLAGQVFALLQQFDTGGFVGAGRVHLGGL